MFNRWKRRTRRRTRRGRRGADKRVMGWKIEGRIDEPRGENVKEMSLRNMRRRNQEEKDEKGDRDKKKKGGGGGR